MSKHMFYPKIDTLFNRGEDFKVIPGDYRMEEFAYIDKWLVTEKLDGCFKPDTRVRMADKSFKKIQHVKPGDYVMGYEDGRHVATRVVATDKKSSAENFLKLQFSQNGMQRGPSRKMFTCTDNHPIWSVDRNQYVPAKDMRLGERVLSIANYKTLHPVQKSTLIGKMLGDGSIHRSKSGSWAVSYGHSVKDKDYVKWTMGFLGDISHNKIGYRTSGYGSKMAYSHSKFDYSINEVFESWYDSTGGKFVPKSIIEDLDPISLAFWYMDDGSLQHHVDQNDRLNIATNGFDLESIHNLQEALLKFNIESKIQDSKGLSLRINEESAERLFLLVAPYVPESMHRKLPERYRNHKGWTPESSVGYKEICVEQTLLSREPVKTRYTRWDIETETSNFFASDILVHNSNLSLDYAYNSGTYRGRTANAQFNAKQELFLHDLVVTSGASALDIVDEYKLGSLEVFGELFGAGIQKGGGYGEMQFRVYDMRVDSNTWLDHESVLTNCDRLGLEHVPVWDNLVSTVDIISIVERGFQTMIPGSGVKSEGVVLKTPRPLYDQRGNRIIAKLKHKDFA